jgi:hypothetical protein
VALLSSNLFKLKLPVSTRLFLNWLRKYISANAYRFTTTWCSICVENGDLLFVAMENLLSVDVINVQVNVQLRAVNSLFSSAVMTAKYFCLF